MARSVPGTCRSQSSQTYRRSSEQLVGANARPYRHKISAVMLGERWAQGGPQARLLAGSNDVRGHLTPRTTDCVILMLLNTEQAGRSGHSLARRRARGCVKGAQAGGRREQLGAQTAGGRRTGNCAASLGRAIMLGCVCVCLSVAPKQGGASGGRKLFHPALPYLLVPCPPAHAPHPCPAVVFRVARATVTKEEATTLRSSSTRQLLNSSSSAPSCPLALSTAFLLQLFNP